jgi:hypothetical protein
MADDPDGSLYQLAFQEAGRAVVQQAGALEALRGRAGMLLAVASLATSFLGALALQDDRPKDLLAWVGVGSFVGLVALTLVMLLPRRWVFSLTARWIIGDYIEAEQPADLATTYRELALHLDKHFERNQRRLNRLSATFVATCVLLAVEVLTWLVIIWRSK